MRVIGLTGTVGMGNDLGGVGGIVGLQHIIAVDDQGRGGVGTLRNVPLAILVDQVGIRGDIHLDELGLLGGGIGTVGILGGVGPVIVSTDIVCGGACGVGGHRIAVGIHDQGILLISIECVVRGGIESSLRHGTVVAVLGLAAVPVVGEEIVGIGGGIIVDLALAVDSLSGIGIGHNGGNIFSGDAVPQAHFVDHAGRIRFFHGNGVNRIAVVVEGLVDHDFLHGQQAGRGADDHGLLIGRVDGALDTDHKVQELMLGVGIGAAGFAVEEVGTADIVRTIGDISGSLLGFDILDGIVVRGTHDLDLRILFAGVVLVAPPNNGVVVICGRIVVGLVRRCLCAVQQFGAGHRRGTHGHAGNQDLFQEGIEFGIGAGCHILCGADTLIEVTVGNDALHILELHVLAQGIGEGNVAIEVMVAGGDLSGDGDRLLLDLSDQGLEDGFHIRNIVSSKVIVVVGQAIHIGLGSGNAVRSKGVAGGVLIVNTNGEIIAVLVIVPVGPPAVGGVPVIAVAVPGIAIGIVALSIHGIGSGIQRDLGQGLVIAYCGDHLTPVVLVIVQRLDLHAHGIDETMVIGTGGITVVMLGDLALIVGSGQRGNETIAFVCAGTGTLLIGGIITGDGGIVPGFIVIGEGGLTVGDDDQERNPGHGLVGVRIGPGLVLHSSQDLGTCHDTGLDVGAAVFTVTEGIDIQGLSLLVPALSGGDGDSCGITAGDIVPVVAGGAALAVDPLQMVGGSIVGIMGQRGQYIGRRTAAGTAAIIALAGEGDHSNPVLLIGLHQGGNGRVGRSHQGLGPVIIIHGTGGIDYEHHVHGNTGLGGQTHDLSGLGNGNQEIIRIGQIHSLTIDGHTGIADRFAHGDLARVQGIVAVDLLGPG